jgi:hypothetical protein
LVSESKIGFVRPFWRLQPAFEDPRCRKRTNNEFGADVEYRRTSISRTKKAQITFPLRHVFPLKVVK